MFHNDLFKLNAAVADGLQSIKALKHVVVRAQRYEQSARLRDVEKLFEQLATMLNQYKYPFTVSELQPDGAMFYKHLFIYAAANNWELPDMLTEKFNTRRSKQHISRNFNESDVGQLISLNNKLLQQEHEITEFMQFISFGISIKGFNNRLTETGVISIKCYTANSRRALMTYGATGSAPFYQMTVSARKLLNLNEAYYDTDTCLNHPENDFLKPLSLKLREEKLCYLFYLLVGRSLLAWEDILNIDRIEIFWDARYLVGAC